MSLSYAQSKEETSKTKTVSEDDVLFYIKPSNAELDFGQQLLSFHRDLDNDNFNEKTFSYLSSNISKVNAFSDLKNNLERAKSISNIKDLTSFYKNCEIKHVKPLSYTSKIEERFDLTIDKYCRSKFLDFVITRKNFNLNSDDQLFFKNASYHYANGENENKVANFLTKIKSNESTLKFTSDELIKNFVELKNKPSANTLKALRSNNDLNLFLKMNAHLDKKSTSYFYEEFTKLNKLAQESIQNENFKLAKSRVDIAIDFYNKNNKYLDGKRVWNSLINTGRAFYTKGRDEDAISVFNKALPISPEDNKSEAIFYSLWVHIANQDYKKLKSAIDSLDLEKNFDSQDVKIKFWIANTHYNNGNRAKANTYFNNIIKSSPFSFYAIISLKELAAQTKDQTEDVILAKLISPANTKTIKADQLNDSLKSSLTRFSVWAKFGDERFLILEQRFIQSLSKDKTFSDKALASVITDAEFHEFLASNTIALLSKHRSHLNAFKLFQNSLSNNVIGVNYSVIKSLFPDNYSDLILKNPSELDPIVVMSLIRQESAFNPNANSRVGARGLMQLMPATAKRYNKKVTIAQLHEPKINIEIGSKYLRDLIIKFDGNLIYTLASYNAGENRIVRWKRELFRNENPLAIIESIPFEETRNYVKLIYRNQFFYSVLNNKSVFNQSIEDSFKVTIKPVTKAKLTASP